MASGEGSATTGFRLDVTTIRDRALLDLVEGAVAPSYGADVAGVISMLNGVLASTVVSGLRYQQHAVVVSGVDSVPVSRCFARHARDCALRAASVAERIGQLGGTPDLDPSALADRSHTTYRTYLASDRSGMIRENLLAVRIVIQVGHEAIRWIGEGDPTTRRLIERILEQDEQHARALRRLLD
jgi:bacterioferritin